MMGRSHPPEAGRPIVMARKASVSASCHSHLLAPTGDLE
jgi:hypothetical protein